MFSGCTRDAAKPAPDLETGAWAGEQSPEAAALCTSALSPLAKAVSAPIRPGGAAALAPEVGSLVK